MKVYSTVENRFMWPCFNLMEEAMKMAVISAAAAPTLQAFMTRLWLT